MEFYVSGQVRDIPVANVIVAGWTGRDRSAIEHHIQELAELGVAPPSEVPLYYRVSAALLTDAARIQVVGRESSGEVEPLIVHDGTELYLGLASDHTDRALEAHSVALSKQVCAKPCASELWPLREVDKHLDQIEIASEIYENGEWVTYQEGTLSAIRPLSELIAGSGLTALTAEGGAAMLCGTLGVQSGGVRPAEHFRMSIRDPVRGRAMTHEYESTFLPLIA